MHVQQALSRKGEYTQKQYVEIFAMIAGIGVLLGVINMYSMISEPTRQPVVITATTIIQLILLYVGIVTSIKRLRNLGRSPYQIFLMLIPIYNILLFLILLTKKSEKSNTINETENIQEKSNTPRYLWLGVGIGVIGLLRFGLTQAVKMMTSMMETNPSYQISAEHIKENKTVKEVCGIIQDISMQGGSISTSGPTGKAEIQLGIIGKSCNGSAYSSLTKSMGEWKIDEIIFDDGNERKNITQQEKNTKSEEQKDTITESKINIYNYITGGISLEVPQERKTEYKEYQDPRETNNICSALTIESPTGYKLMINRSEGDNRGICRSGISAGEMIEGEDITILGVAAPYEKLIYNGKTHELFFTNHEFKDGYLRAFFGHYDKLLDSEYNLETAPETQTAKEILQSASYITK